MSPSIKIIIPEFPVITQDIRFRGTLTYNDPYNITIFITKLLSNTEQLLEEDNKKEFIFGKYTVFPHNDKENEIFSNYLVLNWSRVPHIHKLVVNSIEITMKNNCIIILYDYSLIKNLEIICEVPNCFSKLQCLIENESRKSKFTPERNLIQNYPWLSSSMFIQHLLNCVNLIYWLIYCMRRNKKVSIKQGNLLLAILVDIILGYLILQLLLIDKKELSVILMTILEKFVNSLHSLLKWLMGAPAGLKLNNAFNKMLGKYFTYHIQLWWKFLEVSGEKLDLILHVYHYLGYLGFTFQAAMIADMISITTFHFYCIYVYAARLFNIQVSGLKALMRLFVGRKYNPLRNGIDSCEYTNQELFVGTVAFTILLLLLPTTTLYYIVFTLFRLLSLIVQYVLAELIYRIQTLPLYVGVLWLVRSSKISGNFILEVVEHKTSLILKVKICTKSVHDLFTSFKPPVKNPKQFQWSSLIYNVFSGKQII